MIVCFFCVLIIIPVFVVGMGDENYQFTWQETLHYDNNKLITENGEHQENLLTAFYKKKELTTSELKLKNLSKINWLDGQIENKLNTLRIFREKYDKTSWIYFFERSKKDKLLSSIATIEQEINNLDNNRCILLLYRQDLLQQERTSKITSDPLIDSYFIKNEEQDKYIKDKNFIIKQLQELLRDDIKKIKTIESKIHSNQIATSNIVDKGLVPYDESINLDYPDDLERKVLQAKTELLKEKNEELTNYIRELIDLRKELFEKLKDKEIDLCVSLYVDDLFKERIEEVNEQNNQ